MAAVYNAAKAKELADKLETQCPPGEIVGSYAAE
jgi:hypothetical protein